LLESRPPEFEKRPQFSSGWKITRLHRLIS
jgi:hypothetical protein